MSSASAAGQQPASQIIIVKRNYDGEDGHHGGAWKIAFADFMTAMMAFFLVMWLTNVSDDATKKKIAQYFNPIQLNSMSPANQGLESKDGQQTGSMPNTSAGALKDTGSPDTKPMSGTALGGQEQALFRDPYAVLAEIAASGGTGTKAGSPGVPDGSGLPGLNGGEAYRDPFDPTSWQLEPNAAERAPDRTPMTPSEIGAQKGPLPEGALVTTAEVTAPPPAADAKPAETVPEAKAEDAAAKAEAAAEQLKAEIEAKTEAKSPGASAGVDVVAGNGGITISLADNIAGGMFEIGSAKPTAEALKLVETIGKILSEKQGTVSIRGHTDSRPYAGPEYDNWRLSAARAQFVFYMLARGGLDQARVSGIEGVADRDPKDKDHPEAAANRRIEIFLKEPAA